MQSISRETQWQANGLYGKTFKGLNIFYVNDVELTPPADPRVEFMKCLTHDHRCSAIIGYMRIADLGEGNKSALSKALGVHQYINVGLQGGTFFSLTEYPNPPAWYIPFVRDALWNHSSSDDELEATYFMQRDALALCVGTSEELNSKDLPTFTNEVEWLQFLTKTNDLVITTSGDGYYLDIYARDSTHFTLIEPALAKAVTLIETSEWFRKHASQLVWEESCECLKLPADV